MVGGWRAGTLNTTTGRCQAARVTDGPAPNSLTPADAIDVAELRQAFVQAAIYLSMVVSGAGYILSRAGWIQDWRVSRRC
eukprot:COSAG01_NODE_13284_length_1607_cov_1.366048_2_plen_80_part_00